MRYLVALVTVLLLAACSTAGTQSRTVYDRKYNTVTTLRAADAPIQPLQRRGSLDPNQRYP